MVNLVLVSDCRNGLAFTAENITANCAVCYKVIRTFFSAGFVDFIFFFLIGYFVRAVCILFEQTVIGIGCRNGVFLAENDQIPVVKLFKIAFVSDSSFRNFGYAFGNIDAFEIIAVGNGETIDFFNTV